jgi:hypothetical protein
MNFINNSGNLPEWILLVFRGRNNHIPGLATISKVVPSCEVSQQVQKNYGITCDTIDAYTTDPDKLFIGSTEL